MPRPARSTHRDSSWPQLARGATWRANHRQLMDQAPEMGIAVLNEVPSCSPLRFAGGLWELAAGGGDESCTSGFDRAGRGWEQIGSETRAVVVLGVGLGYWFVRGLSWLQVDPARQLIFFETEVSALDRLLHMPWAEGLLTHPQVSLKCAPNSHLSERAIKEIAWSRLLLTPQCAQSEYPRAASEWPGDISVRILGHASHFDQMAGELLGFSETYYANFARHFLSQNHSFEAGALSNAFAEVPVIVCGAGPSLQEQLPLLNQLKGRALILAGGSGINALCAAGVVPHFGLGIDPNPLQEQRMRAVTAFEWPYLFRRRLFAPCLSAVQGPKVLVRGAAGYPLASWLDEQEVGQSSDQEIEEGHNVIHLAIDAARHFGCRQIVLCGVDLAYSSGGNRGYAPGVLAGQADSGLRPKDLCCDEPLIQWPSDLKEVVWTHWKWVEEAKWIGQYLERESQIDLTNAATGGLGMCGVQRAQLSEWIGSLKSPPRDLYNLVWLQLQIATARKTPLDSAQKRLDPLFASLDRCSDLCQSLLRTSENRPLAAASRADAIPGDFLAQSAQLEQELAYSLILRFPDQMHNVILDREQRALAGPAPSEGALAAAEWAVCRKRLLFLQRGIESQRRIWKGAFDELTPPQLSMQASEKLTSRLRPKPSKGDLAQFSGGQLRLFIPQIDVDLRLPASDILIESARPQTGASCPRVVHRVHDSDGLLSEIYLERGGRRDGQALQLYPSGMRKSEAFYRRDQLHGPSRFYLENGALTGESWFARGQRQGWARQFYRNGQLYSLQGFCDDLPHGPHLTYYSDGSVKAEIAYELGRLVGFVRLMHPNGQLARRTRFCKGLRHGWDRHWSLRGRPLFEAQFSQGVPFGRVRRWHANGQLAEVLRYLEPGGRVETRQFSEHGQAISEGVFRDSAHYTLRAWDTRGQLVDRRDFLWRDGQLVPLARGTSASPQSR